MYNYRFEIVYAPDYMIKASKLMQKLDCGFENIGIHDVMTFKSDKDHDISKLKDAIKLAYREIDCEIFDIKGGKVE